MKLSRFISPNPAFIPQSSGVSRTAKRPIKFRDSNFEKEFDSATVFYDIFLSYDNSELIFVGPPAWNLDFELMHCEIKFNGHKLTAKLRGNDLDRCSVYRIAIDKDLVQIQNRISFEAFGSTSLLSVGDNEASHFQDRRVLMTMSKNNPLIWIKDWVSYYVRHHGADAVLLFDNNSDIYSPLEVKESLEEISGIERAAVVDWPFKYGPQGGFARFWDSDFTQVGAYQTARYRFLSHSKSVLNVDIDELVVDDFSNSSVFEVAERSDQGGIAFNGRWIEPILVNDGFEGEFPRHMDFAYYSEKENRCSTKWCISPKAIKNSQQWKIHTIRDMDNSPSDVFSLRHFRGISTGWKDNRNRIRPGNRDEYTLDERLLELLQE